MVELCELKLMQAGVGDLDIDQHVAQLEFDNSTSLDRSSLFGSVAVDAAMVDSMGDSLDMEALRARCDANYHNDYKLTFEDSGQWTTSGIGIVEGGQTAQAGDSPSTPSKARHARTRNRQKVYEVRDDEGTGGEIADSKENFGLRLLEELNNQSEGDPRVKMRDEEGRRKLIDNLLNNAIVGKEVVQQPAPAIKSGGHPLQGMTTW